MKTSESLKEFAPAFIKAQSEFTPVEKRGKATIVTEKGTFSYNYAFLSDVLKMVLPVLHKNKLGLLQPTDGTGEGDTIETTLLHESGEYISGCLRLADLPKGRMSAMQGLGNNVTYGKRIAAVALLGISAEEDIDGAGDIHGEERRKVSPDPPLESPPEDERKTIVKQIVEIMKDPMFTDLEREGLRTEIHGQTLPALKMLVEIKREILKSRKGGGKLEIF